MTKTIKISIAFLICLFGFSFSSFSQDIIIKKNGKKIWAKIIEINNKQIKYYEYTDQGGLVFTMDRAVIREIEFESGADYEEELPGRDPSYFVDDKQWAAKINFIGFASNTLQFALEKSLTPATSIEGSLKIYGIGINESTRWGSGVGFNIGYKVTTGSIFKGDEYRPKHLLHGGYMRPNIGFNFRNYEYYTWDGVQSIMKSKTSSNIHGGFDIGKQWVFNNQLLLDIYTGFHYFGTGSKNDNNPIDEPYVDSIEAGDLFGEENVAFAFGLKIGVLFGSKSDSKKDKTRRK